MVKEIFREGRAFELNFIFISSSSAGNGNPEMNQTRSSGLGIHVCVFVFGETKCCVKRLLKDKVEAWWHTSVTPDSGSWGRPSHMVTSRPAMSQNPPPHKVNNRRQRNRISKAVVVEARFLSQSLREMSQVFWKEGLLPQLRFGG